MSLLGVIFILLMTMKNIQTFFEEIRKGNTEAVQIMLADIPDLLNANDDRGSTPLILAAYYDQRDIVSLLLHQGAKIDDKDASGNSALMGACFKGYTEVVKQLIEKGASINERNAMGATSLIYAATFNRLEIAKVLIAHGADATVKDGRGNAAIDHAKMQGAPELIDLLSSI